MRHTPFRSLFRFVARVGFAFTLCLLLRGVVEAQPTGARPDRGVSPGGTYSVSDIENVNLQNGNVNLSIPLASLPPVAGGKLSWTVYAYYNSKQWDVRRVEQGATVDLSPRTYVEDVAVQSERGGWQIGGGYWVTIRDARDDFDYQIPPFSAEFYQEWLRLTNYHWWKVVLITPDGSEHELRPTEPAAVYYGNDYDYPRDYLTMYYRETPNTRNAPMRYATLDGTYVSALINPASGTDPVSWTLFMLDGTQVSQYRSGEQRIRDTNGNSIKFGADGVVDEQTGRRIEFSRNEEQVQVSYPVPGGGRRSVQINFGQTTVQGKIYTVNGWNSTYHNEDGSEGAPCRKDQALPVTPLPVVREIVFPQTEPGQPAKRFTFSYNSDTTVTTTTPEVRWSCAFPVQPESYTRTASYGAGSLSRMVTPTGTVVDYTYSNDGVHDYDGPMRYFVGAEPEDTITREVLTTKKLTHDGVEELWTYDIPRDGWAAQSTITNPDGTKTSEDYFPTDPRFNQIMSGSSGSAGMGGLVFRTVQPGRMTEKRWALLSPTGQGIAGTGSPRNVLVSTNPVVVAEYTTLLDAGGASLKTSAKLYQHDYNGNVTNVKEYDWFDPALVQRDNHGVSATVPASAVLLRETATAYHNSPPSYNSQFLYSTVRPTPGTPLILNAAKETTAGRSVTRYSYDGQAYDVPPTRGRVTSVSSFDDQGDADASNDRWLSAGKTYDQYGNVETSTDANGNVTHFLYDDGTHAMPTAVVVDPLNGTGQQTTRTAYDFETGLVTSTTDQNGQTTNIDYTNVLLGSVDPLGRPGEVTSPAADVNGVSMRRRTRNIYEDSLRRVTVETDLRAEGDRMLKSRTTSDQLGRVSLSEHSEDGSGYAVSTRYAYERSGRVTYASNPARSGASPTDGWSRTTRDDAGRVVEVVTFEGASRPAADTECAAATGCTGRVVTEYVGEYTTVTDQAGRVRRTRVDALGRLVRVDESSDANNTLGGYDSPSQATSYVYDDLGNLTEIRQGVQTRTFLFSSLSRLRSATNPESGTTVYGYDANGNLTGKTDARAVATGYEYDGLNRLTQRSYAGETGTTTPTVTYVYDDNAVANSKGRLTRVSSTSSVYSYTAYDALGRVRGSSQTTDGVTYTMPDYRYDLSGGIVSEQYPSGRVVKTEYDAAGRVAGVKDGATGIYYAGGDPSTPDNPNVVAYAAHGAASALRLGNGLWEHTLFNSRLQPTRIGLGTSGADSSVLKLDYTYGTFVGGVLDPTRNSGDVQSQRITLPGLDATQSFEYDHLGRLLSSREYHYVNPCRPNKFLPPTDCWTQVYKYDRFGNRAFDAGTTLPALPQGLSDALSNPLIDPATNRMFEDQNGDGQKEYRYDAAGNVIANAAGQTFVYDGDNMQVGFNGGASAGGVSYSYDANGRRVKKVTASGTTVFVYNAGGSLVAEYSNETPMPGSGGTKYLTTDSLGSPRVVTDQSGGVVSRHDYAPFGEELFVNRTSDYHQDSVRQQFTGQERDLESGLDYFDARYYSSTQGRFTSIDPLAASGQPTNPQTWNRYAYVLNNPAALIDPTGMSPSNAQDKDAPNTPEPQPTPTPDLIPPAPSDTEWQIALVAYTQSTATVSVTDDNSMGLVVETIQVGGEVVEPFVDVGVGLNQIANEIKDDHWPVAWNQARRDDASNRTTGFDQQVVTSNNSASREIGGATTGPSAKNTDSHGGSTATTVQGDRSSRYAFNFENSGRRGYDAYRLTTAPVSNPHSLNNGHYLSTTEAKQLRDQIYSRNERIARSYF